MSLDPSVIFLIAALLCAGVGLVAVLCGLPFWSSFSPLGVVAFVYGMSEFAPQIEAAGLFLVSHPRESWLLVVGMVCLGLVVALLRAMRQGGR
jgi:hypothetical protein